MNLLIVDDEQLEIEGIKATVNFAELGVRQIFEANSMRQAKEIFARFPVDVMLCDIEMPQSNGFELIGWVKETYPGTVCVFVTCHADFNYARQALQLGSLDYLLKPARPDELRRVINEAAMVLRKADIIRQDTRLGGIWREYQPQAVEHFWNDLLEGKILPHKIRDAAEQVGLPVSSDTLVFPVLIRVQRRSGKLGPNDRRLMEFAIKNIALELIVEKPENGAAIEIEEGSLLALMYADGEDMADALEKSCKEYISECSRHLDCELSCYLDKPVPLHKLAVTVILLFDLDKINVMETNIVLWNGSFRASSGEFPSFDMDLWRLLIEQRQKDKLLGEIDKSFQQKLTAEALYKIKLEFTGMIGNLLNAQGVSPYELYNDALSKELLEDCTRSVKHARVCILHGVNRAVDYLEERDKSRSKMENIKRYIDQNLDQELSNVKIASQAFLNPIYLNRLFKKETGLTMSDYVQRERMKKAMELLSKTTVPVSTVALQVGYSNFSHFSRTFRKQTGFSPQDYRKQHSENA